MLVVLRPLLHRPLYLVRIIVVLNLQVLVDIVLRLIEIGPGLLLPDLIPFVVEMLGLRLLELDQILVVTFVLEEVLDFYPMNFDILLVERPLDRLLNTVHLKLLVDQCLLNLLPIEHHIHPESHQ